MSKIKIEEALARTADAVRQYVDKKDTEMLESVGKQKLPITLGAFHYGKWGSLSGDTIEQKAQHLAKYDVIVYQGALSNDLTMSSADYQRDLALYKKALEYNPDLKVFGYVTARGYAYSNGSRVGMTEYRKSPDNVDHPIWTKEEFCAYMNLMAHCGGTKSDSEVDEFGNPVLTGGIPLYGVYYDDYDYNFTNDITPLINQGDWQSIREKHNFLIDYAHSLGLSNMPNSNPYLVFDNEATPNSFTNPDGIPSHMGENDWFSLESYFIRSDSTFGASDHYASDYTSRYRDTYKSKCLALTYIYAVSDDAKDNHQIASTFAVIQAMCQGVDSIALQSANFSIELPEYLTKYYDKNNTAVYSGSNGNYSLTVNGHTISATRSTALTAYGKDPNASALSTCKVIADGRIFNNMFVDKDELTYMFSTVEQNVDEKIKDLKETIADSTNLYHRAFIDDWEEVYTLDDYTNYCFTFQNSTFGNGEGSGSTLTWSAENPYDFKMRVPANGAYRRIEMDARHLAGKTVELGFKSLDVYLEDSPSTKPKLHFYIYCTCESGSNQNLTFTLDTTQKSCIDGVNRWCKNITFAEDLQSLRITIQRMSASPAGAWIVDATGSYMVETNEHPVKKTWFTNYAPSLSAGFLLNAVAGMDFVVDEDGDGVTINYSSTAAVNNQFRVKVPADANILKVGETWEVGVREFYAYDDDGNDVTKKCQIQFGSATDLGVNHYNHSLSYYKNDMASKLNRPLICLARATITANGMPESNLIIKTTNNVGGSTREDGSANYYHIVVKGFYLYRIDESEELFIRGEDPSDTLIGINRVKTDTIDEELAPNTLYIVDDGTMFITNFKGQRVDIITGVRQADFDALIAAVGEMRAELDALKN